MSANPYQVVRDFESAVAEYCGSPFAVSVNSCSNALFLCLMWFKSQVGALDTIEIPRFTYISVPMQIIHAGMGVRFRDETWSGIYALDPLPLYDAARRFTSGMYRPGTLMCTSHHWGKTLGIQQGGCILHDNPDADTWLRRARFDGRTEGVAPGQDSFEHLGWHMYMSPEIAAEGLMRLALLPKHNADMAWDDYPDLSRLGLFQRRESAELVRDEMENIRSVFA